MLTESQLAALPLSIQRDFRRLEADIVQRIAGRIGAIGRLAETDVHQLDELRRIGYDLSEIRRDVAATAGRAQREINDIFRRASEIEYNGARVNYRLTGRTFVPFAQNQQLQALIESISRATTGKFENLPHTLAFVNARNTQGVLVRGGVTQSLAEYYQSVIDYASLQIRTGQADFYGAMRSTIRQMADAGLRTVDGSLVVDYASGASLRLDSAVRMNLMDAQAHLSLQQALITGEAFGANGMEVSWHSGARDSHVWIGGIQVTMDEFVRSVQPVMDEPNCYHRAFPIVLGISTPAHSREELSALNARDAEPREYRGKQYTANKAQQAQREFETQIRKYKDRTIAFTASGDIETAQTSRARVRALQAEYTRFSASMNLSPKRDRTRVSAYH